MEYVNMETKHVTGLPESLGGSGDPSPVTAYGVYMGMKAAAKEQWGSDSLSGKRVLVQGVGHVGQTLVDYLSKENASILLCDINEGRVNEIAAKYGAEVIADKDLFDTDMDIYAPCALGATLNDNSITKLKAQIVAGAANNQLADENIHGKMLQEKGIIYAPDFLINAGGLINVYREVAGISREKAMELTENIYNTTLDIFSTANEQKITTHKAALQIAEERIVMQALYGFFQSEDADLVKAEKNLLLSIDRIYDLYLYYLCLPLELARVAEVQMEEARNKVMPTEEDLSPNRKFVESYLLKALEDNKALQKLLEQRKISWSAENEELHKLWKKVKTSDVYLKFLANKDEHPAAHRKFIDDLYREFVLDSDNLYSIFQEKSIFWDFEDNDFAVQMAMRYFSKIKSAENYKAIPPKYKDKEEDEEFVKALFRKTIKQNKEISEWIEGKTKNWEVDRIATMDVLLMKMAIVEFLHFNSIPVKVSLNEYIEISKLFSTPKSKVFINGVLDKLLKDFNDKKMIKKRGRGLME
ncbi:ldh [Symbiodinium microadriaticum]|nr:ldh [Symbiodinium microadriaticum]